MSVSSRGLSAAPYIAEASGAASVGTAPIPSRPVLLLAPRTGGGHQAAARAIGQALAHRSGGFVPVVFDPWAGPSARWWMRLAGPGYGILIRRVPWLWAALFYGSTPGPARAALRTALRWSAVGPVSAAVRRYRPAVIVSVHPLTGGLAVAARDRVAPATPVVTVVTDLGQPHRLWFDDPVELLVAPMTAAGSEVGSGMRVTNARRVCRDGVPVAATFAADPLGRTERAALRRWLGLDDGLFWVAVTGGGDGAGGIVRRTRAILDRAGGVGVVALCGRNRRAVAQLTAATARYSGRLRVLGFVDNVADWLRCADVAVGKAGPATIAEPACCGVPLLITGHVPGQERGNTRLVTAAGAGVAARSLRRLVREVDRLRRDPARSARFQASASRCADPEAAARIADRVVELVESGADRVRA